MNTITKLTNAMEQGPLVWAASPVHMGFAVPVLVAVEMSDQFYRDFLDDIEAATGVELQKGAIFKFREIDCQRNADLPPGAVRFIYERRVLFCES